MKKLLFILLIIPIFCFAQKDPCEKLFFKEKKSGKKSSVFAESKKLKTKYAKFYSNGNRMVAISFINDTEGNKLEFLSQLIGVAGDPVKREIILGQNIRIALIFADGSNEIIEFNSSHQKLDNSNALINSNEIKLTDELLDKLCKTKIVSTELQNPFDQINESKVKSKDVPSSLQKRIIQIANCFKNSIG